MDLEKKVDALTAAQDKTDERIQALIRVAELQQGRQDHLDAALTSLSESVGRMREEVRLSLVESGKATDERVSALVSAIGELIRRGSPPPV